MSGKFARFSKIQNFCLSKFREIRKNDHTPEFSAWDHQKCGFKRNKRTVNRKKLNLAISTLDAIVSRILIGCPMETTRLLRIQINFSFTLLNLIFIFFRVTSRYTGCFWIIKTIFFETPLKINSSLMIVVKKG